MSSVNKMVYLPYTGESCHGWETHPISEEIIIQGISKKFRYKAKIML